VRISVCNSCTQDGGVVDKIRQALPALDVVDVACMSGCARPQTVAFRAAGKVAYLFGDITADDIPDLCNFANLYVSSPDGTFADARILGDLRMKAIARIPG
tara:strand:+ start:4215 stop:4517 length:303 start_codon:yes stop_codon:yes gene_type:complete